MRSAESGPDHRLVIAKLQIKLRAKKRRRHTKTIFDADKLSEAETKRKVFLSFKNRFEVLGSRNTEDTGSVESIWTALLSAYGEPIEKILGVQKRPK
ncbi:hypothetical protein QYM36_013265 [Artemia franciscana]|uniref:Uncharacterized protein n=1 Tax=Artemia franciscana TaxID=6661 RepID=A0AA88HDU5_ARTSF|nr:hypothetical protein QYM36_013265 [Artemia franciscana]